MMRIVNIAVTSVVGIWAIVSFVWGIKAAYTAFIGKKDERMKMIVVKSMAQSFAALLVFHMINLVLRIGLGISYQTSILNIIGIYIEPLVLNLSVFGTFMFINKRLFSSKGE